MTVEEISVEYVKGLIDGTNSASLLLIDVREPDEYVGGHIAGAVNIPLGSLPSYLDKIDSKREIICVCQVGGRSLRACEYLDGNGIVARNLIGGTSAWISEGHPVVTGSQPK